jgi:uracil-DNA glycosylase family 4
MPRSSRSLASFDAEVSRCRACPRLVAWREEAGRVNRRAFADQSYWSRPVPGFGPADARLLVLGLAPGAHGANRTGRPFTGDGAGPFLYSALHRAGFASDVEPTARDDGLELLDARITNAVRCAPPGNQPSRDERLTCAPFLEREFELLPQVAVILCLGGFAWDAALTLVRARGAEVPRPKPRFGHGVEVPLGPGQPTLVGAFHPSQLNTNTGRLTPAMMDAVLQRVAQLVRQPPAPGTARGAKATTSRRRAKSS